MSQQPYYPPAPAQQQYPQQAYPPQYPQAPAQPTYPPQQAQQPYQQQGYPPPAPPQPSQPLAQGTIDDFYDQPSSGGGPSLKFEQVGTRYVGIVARPITSADVQQQTDVHGRPLTFKDGRPKFVMKVPLQMQPSQTYPDGLAQWYVKGAARDELTRAMSEAGAPAGAPEPGAVIDITHTGTRPSGAGMNPAKLFTVRYTRPQGSEPVSQQAPQGADAPSPAPAPQAPQQAAPPVQEQHYQPAPQQQQQYPPQAPAPQQYEQPAQQQQQTPAAPQPPSDLSAEQQALLARLTGGQG